MNGVRSGQKKSLRELLDSRYPLRGYLGLIYAKGFEMPNITVAVEDFGSSSDDETSLFVHILFIIISKL